MGCPQVGIGSVGVEVAADAAGVVEHTVQHHPHPPPVGVAAQSAKILLRAQHRVNGPVVSGVVAVVGGGFKNGCKIQGGHAQLLQIVQLADDARQVAAEEIAAAHLSSVIRQKVRRVGPAFVDTSVPHHARRVRDAAAAEAVREDLIADAPAEPIRRGGILIHRQLPLREGDGQAVLPAQREAVPGQLRRPGSGVCATKGAALSAQGYGPGHPGELLPNLQLAAQDAVLRAEKHGERHFGAAQNGTEGGFTAGVLGIKINRHGNRKLSLQK